MGIPSYEEKQIDVKKGFKLLGFDSSSQSIFAVMTSTLSASTVRFRLDGTRLLEEADLNKNLDSYW